MISIGIYNVYVMQVDISGSEIISILDLFYVILKLRSNPSCSLFFTCGIESWENMFQCGSLCELHVNFFLKNVLTELMNLKKKRNWELLIYIRNFHILAYINWLYVHIIMYLVKNLWWIDTYVMKLWQPATVWINVLSYNRGTF